jgi:ribosomal protein S7
MSEPRITRKAVQDVLTSALVEARRGNGGKRPKPNFPRKVVRTGGAEALTRPERQTLYQTASYVVKTDLALDDTAFTQRLTDALSRVVVTVGPDLTYHISTAVAWAAKKTSDVSLTSEILDKLEAYTNLDVLRVMRAAVANPAETLYINNRMYGHMVYEAALFVKEHMSNKPNRQSFSPAEVSGLLGTDRLDVAILRRIGNSSYFQGKYRGPVEIEPEA